MSGAEETAAPTADERTLEGASGSQRTVLVIEDNALNGVFLHDLLKAHGYDVVQTTEGLDGLRLARNLRPDLILLDIQLPDVSGLVVSKCLKEDEDVRHIPVIAVTAFAMRGDEEKILAAGCDAYLSKPLSPRLLLETMGGFLDR